MSGTLAGAQASIALDDAELASLGLDPWRERGWVEDDLRGFVEELQNRVSRARERVQASVRAKHRRAHLEPWMTALVDRELATDSSYRAALRVLEVAEPTLLAHDKLLLLID